MEIVDRNAFMYYLRCEIGQRSQSNACHTRFLTVIYSENLHDSRECLKFLGI